jgi:hypothetical protein
MKKPIAILGLLLMSFQEMATAVEVEEPTRLIAQVKGVVCSFCAYGTEKNLARLEFLDKNLFGDGVLMDIAKGLITLAIVPSNTIDFQKIDRAIQNGGYDLEAIHLKLLGTVAKQGEIVALKSSSSGQIFYLVGVDGQPWDPGDLLGKAVALQGVIPQSYLDGEDVQPELRVQVKSLAALKRGEIAEERGL